MDLVIGNYQPRNSQTLQSDRIIIYIMIMIKMMFTTFYLHLSIVQLMPGAIRPRLTKRMRCCEFRSKSTPPSPSVGRTRRQKTSPHQTSSFEVLKTSMPLVVCNTGFFGRFSALGNSGFAGKFRFLEILS